MATETCTRDHPDWCDPFPELRTVPGGWDLSELPRYEPSTDSICADTATALAAEWIERKPNPFPEVRTFPGGWDLSDALALERKRMQKNNEQEPIGILLPLALSTAAYAAV